MDALTIHCAKCGKPLARIDLSRVAAIWRATVQQQLNTVTPEHLPGECK